MIIIILTSNLVLSSIKNYFHDYCVKINMVVMVLLVICYTVINITVSYHDTVHVCIVIYVVELRMGGVDILTYNYCKAKISRLS